jgi:ABC-type uncharacterized transport system substrate-binding protein
MGCSVYGIVKINSEYGAWAAEKAFEIIGGKDPSEIPITQNKQGRLILNLVLAEKLDIVFEPKILKNAVIYKLDE